MGRDLREVFECRTQPDLASGTVSVQSTNVDVDSFGQGALSPFSLEAVVGVVDARSVAIHRGTAGT